MSQREVTMRPRQSRTDSLQLATDSLRKRVAAEATGHECSWSEGVDQGLAQIENELRQRQQAADCPEGPLAQVDETRPTLARQSQEVCRDYAGLLKRAQSLREQLNWAADAFRRSGEPRSLAAVPPLVEERTVPDFGALRQEAANLLGDLDRVREMETALVLESVTTDIGVGD
jgi:hypothetical protein